MRKPTNKTVGKCECRKKGCDLVADIRRQKDHERGRRYLHCPVHGIDRAWSIEGWKELDEWIDANEVGQEPGPAQELEPVQEKPAPALEPEPEKKPIETKPVLAPEPEPEPAPKARGLDSEMSDFMEM